MLVPSTAPLLPNGTTPITNNQILRSQAYLYALNAGADNAKAAVLGSCVIPTSLLAPADTSTSGVMAWIQANPYLSAALALGALVLFSNRKGSKR